MTDFEKFGRPELIHLAFLALDDYRKVSSRFENNYFTEMCNDSEAGSYLRLIDVCVSQL